MLEVGTEAPQFTLKDQDGKKHSLADYRGRWVALWWFPKASTTGCTIEGQAYRDATPDLEAAGVQVLGISFDAPEDQKTFAQEHGFQFPLLSDADKKVGKAYDAEREEGERFFESGISRRYTYLIDPDGKIAKTYDLNDQPDLAAHATQVLADVRELDTEHG